MDSIFVSLKSILPNARKDLLSFGVVHQSADRSPLPDNSGAKAYTAALGML
jgi:hypothetical protein